MISDIVFQVLKSSLFTSLLIGLLLLLVPLLQKRYRAKWRYIAWLVIAVRLLVPFDLSLPQAPIKIEIPEQNTLALVTPPSDERPYLQVDIPSQTDATAISDSVAPPFTPDETAQSSFTITPLVLIGGIWLVGVSAFLLFQAFCYQRFLRKLKTIPTEVIPASIKETIWQIGIDMGICKLPEPVITDIIDAPVLIGVLRPRILLPHTQYTDEALAFILRHELVHYRRRDMLYKLVLLLANAIHWFNPLVYLMTIQAAKDIELACDDDVVRELDRDARGKYGDTILSALPEKRRLEPVFSTRFGSTKKNMKGRLSNLFDMAVKRRGIVTLCAVIACTLTLSSFVAFGYAAARPDSITSRTDSLIQDFAKYKSLGVIYDAGQDAVYYNGERVRLFVEFKPHNEEGMTFAFNLCYQDSDAASTLYLEAVNDDSGKLIGIRRLSNEIALDILENMAARSNQNKDDIPFVVMDATSVIESHGITATDLTKDKITLDIASWIGQCDKKQGAYILNTKTGNVHTTYIYYNGGGRYPWNIGAENDTISVNLYSNSKLSTTDGYYLMCFTSVKDYKDIHLYLNNSELNCEVDDRIILPDSSAQDAADEVTTLTGSNNVTVKSIEVGEVKCIGKIELGPESAYTATISVESGSGTMIALHDSPNVTRHAGTGWNQHYGPGSSIYFSSEQPKTAYVYVGSEAGSGTKLSNVKVGLVQTKSSVAPEGNSYFQIKSNGKSILHSGSFEAKAGQTLTITVKSSIKGGSVDFFLFSPSNKEQHFAFAGSEATQTVELSAGTWAYNCTGFFDSGEIVITGTVSGAVSVGTQSSQASSTDTARYDAEAIRIMDNSGTWGDSINRLLPSMSPSGVKKVVDIYLERHLFPGITTSQAAKQVASTIEPALKYMTKKDQESANSIISAYY